MKKIYAGIGSRKTPSDKKDIMFELAKVLAKKDWTLHTGACKGADQAFAEGALSVDGKVVLHLPWFSYEEDWVYSVSNKVEEVDVLSDYDQKAWDAVYKYHPAPNSLSRGAERLHARNHNIIKNVSLIICWTPEGKVTGGTGQALREAKDLGIDVLNLGNSKDFGTVMYFLIAWNDLL